MDRGPVSSSIGVKPIVVELDSILQSNDLWLLSVFAAIGTYPDRIFGRWRAKAGPTSTVPASTLDFSVLPYNEAILNQIRQVATSGKSVYLCSAGNRLQAQQIADHLGLFAGVILNRDSSALRDHCAEPFEIGDFEYLEPPTISSGNWASLVERTRVWCRLLRVHQWSKNSLVFVPLVTAQRFEPSAFGEAILAFVAFCLAASGTYIVNDLVDIGADRNHPRKKTRPLAAGAIRASHALIASIALVILAGAAAACLSPLFGAALSAYLGLTTAYSFLLKRTMLLDVVTLAGLYTLRVFGGAAAILVPLSEWLLGFSMFLFMALALIKRYVELATRIDAGLPDPVNRNYRKSDLMIVASLAAAASFNAVTVFALYISSEIVYRLYRHPFNLWLICPILMYWLARALMMAHRRAMDDDPILFALRDRNSLFLLILVGAILLTAI
ncbi:UbiA family prenyltransferase [Bradyrhizobium arachidis]|uniref:UbiA family prenyltransferase n=1 Tax=Bradyrhizobium arachidis TaxID=858423 RepID=UPI0021631221|nr:UbiA family prenyltransferase [Bradyrhizobium arachidis]UVO39413.1 UbiA family prenyltransferase [Bradyrhizobium arachidis]